MAGAREETYICEDEEMCNRSEHIMQACKLELKFQRQKTKYLYIAITIENDLSFLNVFQMTQLSIANQRIYVYIYIYIWKLKVVP